jgi:hypothetical protein
MSLARRLGQAESRLAASTTEAPMGEHGTFLWNELNTFDVEGAKRFYEKTIGWAFEAMPMPNGAYWGQRRAVNRLAASST